jgi:hypothetical protein
VWETPGLARCGNSRNKRKTKPAERAISQIEMHLLDQPTFGANAVEIADQQQADHQLIGRRSGRRATGGDLRDGDKNLRGSGIDWPSLQIGPTLRISPVTRIYVRAMYFAIRNAWRHVGQF